MLFWFDEDNNPLPAIAPGGRIYPRRRLSTSNGVDRGGGATELREFDLRTRLGREPKPPTAAERREWDSNPRTPCEVTSLAGKPIQPDSGTSPESLECSGAIGSMTGPRDVPQSGWFSNWIIWMPPRPRPGVVLRVRAQTGAVRRPRSLISRAGRKAFESDVRMISLEGQDGHHPRVPARRPWSDQGGVGRQCRQPPLPARSSQPRRHLVGGSSRSVRLPSQALIGRTLRHPRGRRH